MPTWKSDADDDNEKKTSSKRLYTTLDASSSSSVEQRFSRRQIPPLPLSSRAIFVSPPTLPRRVSFFFSFVVKCVDERGDSKCGFNSTIGKYTRSSSSKTTLFCLNFLPFFCGSRFFVSFPKTNEAHTVFNEGKNLSSKEGRLYTSRPLFVDRFGGVVFVHNNHRAVVKKAILFFCTLI